jgi:hypothetical protein
MSNTLPPQQQPADPQISAQAGAGTAPTQEKKPEVDKRTQDEVDLDNILADRLSQIIENANEQLIPICEMVRKVSWSCFMRHQATEMVTAFR